MTSPCVCRVWMHLFICIFVLSASPSVFPKSTPSPPHKGLFSLFPFHISSSINNNSESVSSQLSQIVVIDLGSRSCGTPEDSFTDNVVYLLGRRNEGSFQSCHLLIGCGKYGSIWPAVSLYVRHTRVCVNIMRRRADRCVLFPRQVLYTDQQRVRTCVRPCVCVITLERRREGGGGEPG